MFCLLCKKCKRSYPGKALKVMKTYQQKVQRKTLQRQNIDIFFNPYALIFHNCKIKDKHVIYLIVLQTE